MGTEKTLRIFNIQRYSLHDGSGIRTVIFLKGCPLRCRWCCNPESQNPEKEIMYRKSRCLGAAACGLCKTREPKGAILFDEEGKAFPVWERLKGRIEPAEVCPSEALQVVGRDLPVSTLLEIAEEDAAFYRGSEGGLTLSGGEPLMQENALVLLEEAKKRHLHTAVETCGFVPKERLLRAAGYLDEVFFDIKSVDDKKHERFTGAESWPIRNNLSALCRKYPEKKITVRTPVIPTFNDSEKELFAIEKFLSLFPNVTWEKLPYHTFGKGKYEMLGRPYPLEEKGDEQADAV